MNALVQDVGLAIVRGERSWRDAALIGISVEPSGARVAMAIPWEATVSATLRDIATGLLAAYQQSDVDRRMWAAIVRAIVDPLDEVCAAWHDEPELFLDALWELDVEGTIDPEAGRVARSILAS